MAKKHESKWNIEDLSDAEIYDAIRYLETDLSSTTEQDNDNGVVICVCLYILLFGCLAFLWFYWR
jgi:hypothetical protein